MLTNLFCTPIGKEPWTDEGTLLEQIIEILDLLGIEDFSLNIEEKINVVSILSNIREELEEYDTDKRRIIKWFNKAKSYLDKMSLEGEKADTVERLCRCVKNLE